MASLVSGIAQAPTDTAGPIVKDIVVETVGAPSITKERVLANLATKVGQPYSERSAEQDVRALYTTGGVSNVRIFAEPLGDGVKVTVLLQGRPVLEEILIEGAVQIPSTCSARCFGEARRRGGRGKNRGQPPENPHSV